MWVTWRLLVFGRVSADSTPEEEAVTTREVAAAVAAAGGREEVGLALRGVWQPCQVPAPAFREAAMGRGKETRGQRTSPAGPAPGERISCRPIRKVPIEKGVGIN